MKFRLVEEKENKNTLDLDEALGLRQEKDVNESLQNDEISLFFKRAKEVGAKTLGDLKRLLQEPEFAGKDEAQGMKDYRDSLGKDFKIEESLDLDKMQGIKLPDYYNTWSAIDSLTVSIDGKEPVTYYLMENDVYGDETFHLVVTKDLKTIYETFDDIETCLRDELDTDDIKVVDNQLKESANSSDKLVAKYYVPHIYKEGSDIDTLGIYQYEDDGDTWYSYKSNSFGSKEGFESENEAYQAFQNNMDNKFMKDWGLAYEVVNLKEYADKLIASWEKEFADDLDESINNIDKYVITYEKNGRQWFWMGVLNVEDAKLYYKTEAEKELAKLIDEHKREIKRIQNTIAQEGESKIYRYSIEDCQEFIDTAKIKKVNDLMVLDKSEKDSEPNKQELIDDLSDSEAKELENLANNIIKESKISENKTLTDLNKEMNDIEDPVIDYENPNVTDSPTQLKEAKIDTVKGK